MNSETTNPEAPQKTSGRRAVEIAAVAILIAAIGLQVLECTVNPLIQMLTTCWWRGTESQFVGGWKSYDRETFKAAGGPEGRNAALVVFNLDPQNSDNTNFTQAFLCRGSYALYPRRIWAAEEGTVLNNGIEAINSKFNPSAEWLRAHDVSGVLWGYPDQSGAAVAVIRPVSGAGR